MTRLFPILIIAGLIFFAAGCKKKKDITPQNTIPNNTGTTKTDPPIVPTVQYPYTDTFTGQYTDDYKECNFYDKHLVTSYTFYLHHLSDAELEFESLETLALKDITLAPLKCSFQYSTSGVYQYGRSYITFVFIPGKPAKDRLEVTWNYSTNCPADGDELHSCIFDGKSSRK